MGNQQATQSGKVPLNTETPIQSLKIHPQIQTQQTKTEPKNQLSITTPQLKMKRSLLSLEPSFSSIPQRSRLKVKRQSSTDNIQAVEKLQDLDFLTMQKLDNIYFLSESNLQSFLSNLEEPLSELYMTSAKHAMNLMNSKISQTARQAKLLFCQKLLNTNLNILKTLGSKKNHQFDENIFRKFNGLQKIIIGYLKAKYPKGQQNFVSGDLMNTFKSFDYIDSPENDIVRQSGLYFGKSNVRDLMKKIKEFLNSLIDEVDVNFPRFQRILQQKVFKTTKTSDKSLEYKINRRLPENVSKFTPINSNSLDIVSPELFRVIFKWIEDMQQFILNTDEEVDSKQTLKVINQEDDTKYFADQINTDDNYFVLKELKQKLYEQKQNYQKELNQLIENMYKFQHNLIKIIEEAELSERYVPRKDAEIIKFSAYNTKFMSWMLAEKLTIALKILIKVGRHFKNTMLMMPLDLVKFNVTDMLRATLKGSKSELLEVYTNLKKLESEDQIKIIRLDNQLGTALNGIVINFKMKNCFLICQVSLILSESNHGSSQKLKNIEKLNNFFSDLEGSPYGVLSELAEYVGYKDSKVGYEDKVNFISKQFGIPICEIRHPNKIESIKQQYEPFVCTSCSKFYGTLENTFIMKKCKECNSFLCFKCSFAKNPSLESSCLKEEIIKYLNDQATYSSEVTRGRSEGSVQGITGNLIYQKSFERIIYMKQIEKEKKLKKMNRTQFEVYVNSLKLNNFVYGTYEKGEITLISLKYSQNLKQLSFGLNENEDFYSSKRLRYKENDFLLIYDSKIKFASIQNGILEKQPFINIFSKDRKLQKGKYESYKINEVNIVKNFTGQEKEEKVIIDGMEVIDTNDSTSSIKKEFRFQSLKNYLQFHGIIQSGRTTLKLQDLGIEKSHLLELTSMKWLSKITELNISKNKITQINEILQHLPNLERLSATQNYIQTISFPKKLSKLVSLVLKRNLIKSILNLDNIPMIEKINLEENKIQKFPIVSLQSLRQLNLAQNCYLTSIQFLEKCNLPQLNYVNLENSLENVQYLGHDEDRVISLNFPKLKCFIANTLKASQITFTSPILQRLYLTFCPIIKIKTNLIYNLQYFVAGSCKFSNMTFLFNQSNENHIIKEIDLSYNSITDLPSFIKSNSLQKLTINSNLITDIKSLSKSYLPLLQSLRIENNQIKFLPSFDFPKLTELRLQGNPFDEIHEFAKSSLPLLETLQFSEAFPIKSWPKFSLSAIKSLSLPSVQEPSTLTEFQTSQLPSLQHLSIQSTKLNKFPLLSFQQLESLKVYYSTFEQMDTLVQSKLSNLKKIDIMYVNPQDYNKPEEEKKQYLKKYKIDLPNNLQKLEEISVTTSQFFDIENLLSKSFKNVTEITIQFSNLSTVPKMTLPNLKFIYLSNNKIDDIANFCDSELPQIQEIDLSSNQITMFSKLNFKTLKNLNISRNQLKKLETLDLPTLNRLDFSYNKLTQFPVIWSQKLTEMIFEGNLLKNMRNLQKCHIPNLNNIAFSSIQLEEGSKVCPKFDFPSIQSLYIYGMNFTQISNINCLTKLQTLTISYCKEIKDFPCLRFPELKTLNIFYSQFQSWKGFQESKIENVTSLMISWTNIEVLKGTKLPNLIDLNVNQNEKLTSIEEFLAFNKFVQLESVVLNGNKKLSITHEINLPTLKKIDITFSSLTSTKLIGNSDRLTDIRVAESFFNEINLREFKKLQNLEMMANKIQNIDSFCLKDWRSLKILYLSQNKISKVPKMTKFPLLEILNLSLNQIQNVNDLMQNSALHSIASLTLSKNKIKNISSIKNFPKLTSLDLQENEIESLAFLSKLQNVNSIFHSICLNSNKIQKDISAIKCGVEHFQLNNNLIQSMEWLKKSQLPRLSYLDLSNNNIRKLTSIQKLSKLSTLVINLNPVEQYDELLYQEKLPASCGYISISAKVSQNAIDADILKFTAKYPNVLLSISEFGKEQKLSF